MNKVELNNPWRPWVPLNLSHIFQTKGVIAVKSNQDKILKQDDLWKIKSDEELIEEELEEAEFAQWPVDDEYLGYIIGKVERKERIQNKKDKRFWKKKDKKVFPDKLKDKVLKFLTKYAEMKSEAITTDQQKELKEYVETTRKTLYNDVKGYKAYSPEVRTLIKLLTEKPSL